MAASGISASWVMRAKAIREPSGGEHRLAIESAAGELSGAGAVGVGRPDAEITQRRVEPSEGDPTVGRPIGCCCWRGAAQHRQRDGQGDQR
jgi:hypothetical protein